MMINSSDAENKPQKAGNLDKDTILITDIILSLARQIKIIIFIPTILCTITIIYLLFFAKPVYVSNAKIISSSSGGGSSQAAGLAAQFGINILPGQTETKWVYPEIIKSRLMARAILNRKFDTSEFGTQKSLLQILTHGNNKPDFKKDTLEIIAVKTLLDMVKIDEDMATGIFTLEVNALEPKLATDINNAFIEELDAHQRRYNKSKTSDAKNFISERIVDTEKELATAEENLKVFRDRNRRIENSPSLQLEQQRLVREVTVLTGVFTTLKQQLETTKIEEVKESEYVIVVDPPNIPLFPSKPKKKIVLLSMGFIGLFVGLLFAFFRDYAKTSDKETIEKVMQAKLILFSNIKELIPNRLKKKFTK